MCPIEGEALLIHPLLVLCRKHSANVLRQSSGLGVFPAWLRGLGLLESLQKGRVGEELADEGLIDVRTGAHTDCNKNIGREASFLAPDRQVLQEIALLLPEKRPHLPLHLLSLLFGKSGEGLVEL